MQPKQRNIQAAGPPAPKAKQRNIQAATPITRAPYVKQSSTNSMQSCATSGPSAPASTPKHSSNKNPNKRKGSESSSDEGVASDGSEFYNIDKQAEDEGDKKAAKTSM